VTRVFGGCAGSPATRCSVVTNAVDYVVSSDT
jgi:hypothetical protein